MLVLRHVLLLLYMKRARKHASNTKIFQSAVKRSLKRKNETGENKNHKRFGRPKITTKCEEKFMFKVSVKELKRLKILPKSFCYLVFHHVCRMNL